MIERFVERLHDRLPGVREVDVAICSALSDATQVRDMLEGSESARERIIWFESFHPERQLDYHVKIAIPSGSHKRSIFSVILTRASGEQRAKPDREKDFLRLHLDVNPSVGVPTSPTEPPPVRSYAYELAKRGNWEDVLSVGAVRDASGSALELSHKEALRGEYNPLKQLHQQIYLFPLWGVEAEPSVEHFGFWAIDHVLSGIQTQFENAFRLADGRFHLYFP